MSNEILNHEFLHGGDYNPEQWLESPEILAKDIEYFKKAHINTVTVGVFSWSMLEPEEGLYDFGWLDDVINKMKENGIHVILATPSGARPKWMADKYPEVLRVEADRHRNLFGARHNHCYTSPVYREKIAAMNRELVKHYDDNPAVVMWHISNEFGGECHCPLCQEKFREWLKEKYGTIQELNRRWSTTFWSHRYNSFDEVESPSPRGEMGLHALNLDWKRFVTDRTIDYLKHEVRVLRESGSTKPITANLMYDFNGLDYKKFKDVLDIVSWDNYPTWHKKEEWVTGVDCGMQHDLMRSIKKEPFLLMESCPSSTNWQPISKLKKPGMHKLASLQAVAHGSDSVLYFQLRQSQGASEKFHGAVIDHYGGDDTRVFAEVTEVGEALETLKEVAGSKTDAKVAILYDRENIWAMKDAQGPRNQDLHYEEMVQKQYSALRKLGLNVDVISTEHDLEDYKLVTVPMSYMFPEGYDQKLRAFAANGGTLVLSYWTGIVDDTDRCYLGGTPHGLMEAAGLRSTEIDGLYDWEENMALAVEDNHLGLRGNYVCRNLCDLVKATDAEVLLTYETDFYAGMPVLTHKAYENGHVYYICSDMEEGFFDDFFAKVADEAELYAPISDIPKGVSVTTREKEGVTYLFAQNFGTESTEIEVPEGYEILLGEEGGSLDAFETKVWKKGEAASFYTMENAKGMKAVVSDFGATLVKVEVPDKEGKLRDVVLGYDDIEGYKNGELYIGGTIGRVANRIAGASFELNGKTYELHANDNENTNHGGKDFYHQRMWKVEEADKSHVTFSMLSPNMDQGFPGNLQVNVTYTLTDEGAIEISYEAVSDEDTLVNLTNHSYFNLNGQGSGSVLGQEVCIDADAYTRADEKSITTGELVMVEGTPMDFRTWKTLGADIEADYDALTFARGYDQNWVANGSGYRKVAQMRSNESGIQMEVYTDLPGVHLYTANYVEHEKGKGGVYYEQRDAVCFETQYFPDAVHKDHFEGPVLKAGEKYQSKTGYKFS